MKKIHLDIGPGFPSGLNNTQCATFSQKCTTLKEAMQSKGFCYTFDFGNEHSTLFGFDGSYFKLQRVYNDSAEEDISTHCFSTYEKLESYMESWFGEGYLDYLSEKYENELEQEEMQHE